MPIRFVDRSQTIVGHAAVSLADVSPNFDGTFTAAPGRTGAVAGQLQNHSAAISGIFQVNANRSGAIVSTLVNATSVFVGTAPGQQSAQTFQFSVEGSGTEWISFGHTFASSAINSAPILTTAVGGAVTHQAQVHARHPNGSVRFCTYSAQLTGGQSYFVADGTAPSGTARTVADLLAAIPGDIASVTLSGGITGTMTARDLLTSATNRAPVNNSSSIFTFESGPQMLGVVLSQNFNTHLRVTMHLRWYGGTTLWCDFLFENGYVNLAGMGSRSYTAQMVLNGVSAGSQALAPHYNRTMWHKAAWSTGGTLYARLQGATLTASKAFPNYDRTQVPSAVYLNGLRSSTVPMDNGDNTDDLDDTGEQQTLGIVPRWDASFITSDCDVRNYRAVLANADGGMAYNYSCLMDSATGEHLSVSDRTTFTSQQPGLLGSGYTSGTSPFDAGNTGTFPAHMPSIGYTAFALTGQWSFLRAMHGWASFTPFYSDTNRNFSFNGRTLRRFNWISSRGVGWSYRTLGQAAYITPDSHYLKLYYNNEVNGVFGVDAAEFNSTYSPIGLIEMYEITSSGDHPEVYRMFMHNFLSQAVSHVVCDLGFTSGQNFAAHVAKLPAGLMGNTNEFKWNFAASYTKKIGTTAAQANWFTNFTQMTNDTENVPSYAAPHAAGSQALANAMFSAGDIPTATAGSITGRPNEAASYYANMQPAVSYLPALGVAGGLQCWTRYISGQKPDYSDKPQFNIVPRATTVLQAAALTLAPGQCVRFGSIPGSVLNIDQAGFSVLQYMSSGIYNPIYRTITINGKRSSADYPYRRLVYRESTDAWTIVGNSVFPGGTNNQNGHGYDHNTIDPDTGIEYFRPYNDVTVWYYNPGTNVWAALADMGSPQPEIAGFLEWIPGTGLVYGDRRTLRRHPGASSPGTAWTTVENLGSVAQAYHAAASFNRNSQIFYWGWGNADNNARKCGPSLTGITTTNTLGDDFGSSEFGGLITPDPVGRGFIGWKKQTLTWKHYDPDTNTVTTLTRSTGSGATVQTGTPNLGSDATQRHAANITIDPYRIIMYLQNNGSGADVWLYRHT